MELEDIFGTDSSERGFNIRETNPEKILEVIPSQVLPSAVIHAIEKQWEERRRSAEYSAPEGYVEPHIAGESDEETSYDEPSWEFWYNSKSQ